VKWRLSTKIRLIIDRKGLTRISVHKLTSNCGCIKQDILAGPMTNGGSLAAIELKQLPILFDKTNKVEINVFFCIRGLPIKLH
jgi:hypothetical protein